MRYFFVVNADWYTNELVPRAARSWQCKSLADLQAFRDDLGRTSHAFGALPAASLTKSDFTQIPMETPFRRDLWRLLVGEILLLGAEEMPELETPLDTYAEMFDTPLGRARTEFPPIQQAVLGTRDVCFGSATYRPDFAGLNAMGDVVRLASWLGGIDASCWLKSNNRRVSAEDVEFACDWFALLQQVYSQAAQRSQMIVCETVE